MADDRMETREINWRQWMPFTELFRGFRVALGFNKLLLAAAGIITMAVGWYILASVFYSTKKPEWPTDYPGARAEGESPEDRRKDAWANYKSDLKSWNLILRAAGPATDKDGRPFRNEIGDLAQSPDEFEAIKTELENIRKQINAKLPADKRTKDQIVQEAGKRKAIALKEDGSQPEGYAAAPDLSKDVTLKALRLYEIETSPVIPSTEIKKSGQLSTLPWFEDRGPNPYLMVTGQTSSLTKEGEIRHLPWNEGTFIEWLSTQGFVLLEPLVKVLRPVIFFFHPDASLGARFYFLLVLLFTLATWSFFGGAITRIAAVEIARNEKIGLVEALRFTCNRWMHYVSAPMLPLLLVAALLVLMWLIGLVHLIPAVGDFIDGLVWWLPLILGLIMAGVLVGLISWPMMAATISAEDEEALNAVSRSYSYVIQSPWHYLWYGTIALLYGAVVIFFVGFMGSLTVYLAKWGVGQPANTAGVTSREPSYLFVYAPTSFGWRDLLLEGAKTPESGDVVVNGRIDRDRYQKFISSPNFTWYKALGATLVSIWLYLFFLLVLAFGYSYFWSAGTIIYLLMRKKVDDAELDEVYLEEEDQEEFGSAAPSAGMKPSAPPPSPPPPAGVTMVDAPALRQPAPPPPAPAPAPAPAPKLPEDGAPVGTVTAPPVPAKSEVVPSADGGNNSPPEDEKAS